MQARTRGARDRSGSTGRATLARKLKRLIALTAVAVAAVVAPADAAPFRYGVAAGDVTTSSAILWARADKAGRVTLTVARNRGLSRARRRYRVRASKASDLTVQRRVTRLRANTRYYYRFVRRGRSRSALGTFRTAPKPSSNATIEFGWTGDYDAQPAAGRSRPFWNNFDVFRRMERERNHFNVALGDTIYSDSEVPGARNRDAVTVAQKWRKYRMNLSQRELASLRGAAGFYSHWDDHEFFNDFSPAERQFETGSGANERILRLNGRTLYRRGAKAFRDYAPVRYSSRYGLYRSVRWGRNLELFFLDERSFRSAKADAGGACNNPRTNKPDYAPAAPQRIRNTFALIEPSFGQPVSQACLDTINDPNRTYLGRRQLGRFMGAIRRSKARFKVVMNELPIQEFFVLPYDRWEGYEAERRRLLRFLRGNVKNVVFLTTDVHATLVNEARIDTFGAAGPEGTGILDVTVGSAATENLESEIDGAVNRPGSGRLADDVFLEPQPPNGVGMRCSQLKAYSYGQVRVTSTRLTITPKDIAGRRQREENGAPCGPFVVPFRR